MAITIRGGSGGENVTPEVTEQVELLEQFETLLQSKGAVDITPEVSENTDLIAQVMAELEGKAFATDPSVGATATADKIIEGYTAAVNGQLITGIASAGLTPEMFGCTKMAVDKFTYSSNTAGTSAILSHTLNEKPTLFFVIPNKFPYGTGSPNEMGVILGKAPIEGTQTVRVICENLQGNSYYVSANTAVVSEATVSEIGVNYMFMAGNEYTLITMA